MASEATIEEKGVTAEEATAEFSGSLVRLDCGEEGVYQGIVVQVDPAKTFIKIKKPFRNGISLGNQVAVIPGELIKDVFVVQMTPATPKEVKESKQKERQPMNTAHTRTRNGISLGNQVAVIPEEPNKDVLVVQKTLAVPTKVKKSKQKEKQSITGPSHGNQVAVIPEELNKDKTPAASTKMNKPKQKEKQVGKKEGDTTTMFAKSEASNKKSVMKKEERNKREKEKRAVIILKRKSEKKKEMPGDGGETTEKKEVPGDGDQAKSLETVQQGMEKLSCGTEKDEKVTQEVETSQETPNLEGSTDNSDNKNSPFYGCLVTVTCVDSPDIYQGTIEAVNADERSVQLQKPLL